MYFCMRRIVVCGLVGFSCLAAQGGTSMLFSHDGTPSRALYNILRLTGVEHDGTMSDIVAKTQKLWLRKPGQERWDIEKTVYSNAQELWQEFRNCDLILEITPQKNKYDYILFMGATVQRMKLRCDYLMSLINSGLVADTIVILSGARQLDSKIDEPKYLEGITGKNCSETATECDAAQQIIELGLPDEVKRYCKIEYIHAPMKLNKEGVLVRPTTDDTLIAWQKTNPKPGSCLIISNQPYGQRQELVVQHLLPGDFTTDVASSACYDDEANTAVVLDELARLIYQEHAIMTKKSKL